jgi:hypothetical protein
VTGGFGQSYEQFVKELAGRFSGKGQRGDFFHRDSGYE